MQLTHLYIQVLAALAFLCGHLGPDATARPTTMPAPAEATDLPAFVPDLGMEDYDAPVRELLDQGDFYGALAWVQEALEENPEEYRARFMRAVLNAQRFEVRDVARDLERVADIEPLTPIVLVARLQLVALHDAHRGDALAGLHELAHWPNGGHWVVRLLGIFYVNQENYTMARRYTERLVRALNQPDPWLLRTHSCVLANTGRLEQAVESVQQALSALSLSAFYNLLAGHLYQAGDLAAADAALKEAISRSSPNRGPLLMFIESLRQEPDGAAARQRYEEVIAAHRFVPGVRVTQAQNMQYLGHSQEALDILYTVVDSAPRHDRAEALRRIGRIYDNGGKGVPVQRDKAADYMRRAAGLGDAHAAGFTAFILDYPRSGDRSPDEAYRFYQQAALRGDKQSMSNLGIMYRSGRGIPKDTEKALILYLKAMHGGFENAYNNAAWMLLNEPSLWDERVAVNWAEHAAQEYPCNPHFNTLIRVHLHSNNVNAADQAWHRWHRWWRRTHGEDSDLPRNFQNLRRRIDTARERASGGAS